ncbi:type II toxin-antitoxin system HigB family toxin [Pseudomonas sp. RP23018S]|uniref:type II toxin-antitoxin system HigB family toxin n=1 Tax=Pseudomonas sp. RP23018S TaxID=3096037 RepID=UPI002ACAF85C|nr:type II toxin-antitoxin system HigB family toxin [Pseudomonas sp. RP23018S]MDZ5604935.1 type II toxin-antitoxin system HigB family toxin [Pseudomonas sp. RP23018S]
MRVIAKSTLVKFCNTPGYEDAFAPLQSWHDMLLKAHWSTPQELKAQIGNASICGNNRVVFNIAGNKYRLVVEMQYRAGIAWVKFVGTHKRYDEIDVEAINEC